MAPILLTGEAVDLNDHVIGEMTTPLTKLVQQYRHQVLYAYIRHDEK